MSMIVTLTTVSDSNISRMLEDPPLVWRLVAPDDPEVYSAERSTGSKPGFLARLFGGSNRAVKAAADLALTAEEGHETDLDKAWHGIHYLLNGMAWVGNPPLDFLVAGGHQIGEIEVGYGPARAFLASDTVNIHRALRAVDEAQLRDRFDPDDMIAKEIYPKIWSRNPSEDDALGYVVEYYSVLGEFLDRCAERKVGFLVCVN